MRVLSSCTNCGSPIYGPDYYPSVKPTHNFSNDIHYTCPCHRGLWEMAKWNAEPLVPTVLPSGRIVPTGFAPKDEERENPDD